MADPILRVALLALTPAALVFASPAAWAHAALPSAEADAWLGALIGFSLVLYALGARNLWRAALGHRLRLLQHGALFFAGSAILALAVLPPVARLAAETFAGHMLQHEVLMVVAAPLLVLGRPLPVWAWAFTPAWRLALPAIVRRRGVRGPWEFLTAPVTATVLHAAAIWGWHAPPLFAAAQDGVWMHALQHASFFFTGLLFWNAVFRTTATALFWLFVTMLHTGFLGVLLAFSPKLWYPQTGTAAAWGLTALEDQQLGGLIMWVPGGTIYVIAAVALVARWLRPARA